MPKNSKIKASFLAICFSWSSLMSSQVLAKISVRQPSAVQNPSGLREKQIKEINMEKLTNAKNLAKNLDVIHAVLDINQEWLRLQSYRNKKQSVENLVSTALTAAAEGRFQSAEFMLKDVTSTLEADDNAVWSADTKNQLKTALDNLRALLARETVRTGLQAVEEYYLSATIKDYSIKHSNKKFLFFGSGKDKSEYITTEKSLIVRVPELSTGNPVYDQQAAKEFGTAPGRLGVEAFKSELLGLVQPYEKVKSNDWGLHVYVPGLYFDWDGIFVGWTHSSPMYGDWYRREGRNAEKMSVKFQKISYLPLAPADRIVWQGAINEKANRVKAILKRAWTQSGEGYKFRQHSSEYDQFLSFLKIYDNSLSQLSAQKENSIMTFDQLNNLDVQFAKISGNRPNNLEMSIELGLAKAHAFNETAVENLIKESLVFSNQPFQTETMDEIELTALTADNNSSLSERIRQMEGRQLKQALISMYMAGKETQVRDIFLKLSGEIQRKFNVISANLDSARNQLIQSLEGLNKVEVISMLNEIAQAKQIIDKGFSSAIEPTLILSQEEITSLTEQKKTSMTYKRIYRAKTEVQLAQQNLRRALSEARSKVASVYTLYRNAPHKEVRQALIGFMRFFNTKIAEFKAEPWFFKQMGELRVLFKDKKQTEVAYEEDDNGVKKPIYTQDFTIDVAPLLNEEQEKSLNLDSVYTAEQVEYIYLSNFSTAITDKLSSFSVAIGNEFNKFDEFPSHTIAVVLKNNIDNFYSLRKQAMTRFINEPIAEDVKDLTRIIDVRKVHGEIVKSVNWITEITGKERHESDLINLINNAKPRYNDLLQ